MKKWRPKKAPERLVKDNIIAKIDNYFTSGCILNEVNEMTTKCNTNHTCKLCAFEKRLKVINPCANCFHNQLFKPIAGNGECHWVEKLRGFRR